MNTYQNKEAKKYLVGMAVCSFMAILVFVLVMCILTERWKTAENRAILSMLEAVYEQYPEADLAQFIQALNNATINDAVLNNGTSSNDASNNAAVNDSVGQDDDKEQTVIKEELAKYGIDNSIYYIKEMQSAHRLAIYAGMGLFLIAEILIVSIFVFYLKKRQRELFLLENYMERISDGDYNLDLSDNSEDELSSLKNHLYKLTIMLKEQARIAGDRKAALAESVSDISHQLKTPLTSAQILLDNINDNPDMNENI